MNRHPRLKWSRDWRCAKNDEHPGKNSVRHGDVVARASAVPTTRSGCPTNREQNHWTSFRLQLVRFHKCRDYSCAVQIGMTCGPRPLDRLRFHRGQSSLLSEAFVRAGASNGTISNAITPRLRWFDGNVGLHLCGYKAEPRLVRIGLQPSAPPPAGRCS